jgi:predicted Rossmann-fold nucleotide-binding protein
MPSSQCRADSERWTRYSRQATLVQTGKIQQFPLVLMGRDYWEPLLAFMRERLVAERTVELEDVDRFIVTDSPEEAVELITQTALGRFGLTYGTAPRRRWFLGE